MVDLRGAVAVATVIAALTVTGCGDSSRVSNSSCADVAKPKPHASGSHHAPNAELDVAKRWTLTFRTSCGSFTVQLAPQTSPHATASLVALARSGFFDGTIFHRIVPGFVIQGGDPTQTGRGGPGYTTVDTPAAGTQYAKGVVAMGKTAVEPRGTAASQFFVMTAAAPSLAPDYAVVGRVVSGLDVVERIGELGDPNDPNGTPTKTVVIDEVVVGVTGP